MITRIAGPLLLLALLLLPATALAQTTAQRQAVMTVTGPKETAMGDVARITATLRDGAGKPIADARIIFTSPATFGGITGDMAVGEAWTDARGTAALDYQLRVGGQNRFIARFYGDGTYGAAEGSAEVQATGLAQIAQRSAGVHVPVLGSWTIIAVLFCVWSVYFVGMLQVSLIPKRRDLKSRLETGGQL